MKHWRAFGLLAIPVMAIVALTGTASADVATSPTGTVYTGAIQAVAEGHIVLDSTIAQIECASSFEAAIENHGKGWSLSGNVASLSFHNCTNSWHVTVVSAGSLYIKQTLGSNGEASSSGATIEMTRFGITCRYATKGSTLGQVTSGHPATMDFGLGAFVPFHSGSAFCGLSEITWTGSYKVITPESLYFDTT